MTDYRFQKQKYGHDPDRGIWGDCHRTAIACMLNMPRDDVPHFHENGPDPEFNRKMAEWLAFRGFVIATFVFRDDLDVVMGMMAQQNPGARYMLLGTSATGVDHVVVARDDKIEHDPSLKDAGIVGPCSQGFYWVELIVPITVAYG